MENNLYLTEFFQEDGPTTQFEVHAASELNDPSLFVDGADPEIVTEQELQPQNNQQQDNKKKEKEKNYINCHIRLISFNVHLKILT